MVLTLLLSASRRSPAIRTPDERIASLTFEPTTRLPPPPLPLPPFFAAFFAAIFALPPELPPRSRLLGVRGARSGPIRGPPSGSASRIRAENRSWGPFRAGIYQGARTAFYGNARRKPLQTAQIVDFGSPASL